MNWKRHYTGHDYVEFSFGSRVNLFLKRNSRTARGTFARLSFKIWRRWRMLGVFIGPTNYLQRVNLWNGVEFFTTRFGLGYGRPLPFGRCRLGQIAWSGSMVQPYYAMVLRFWRFAFYFDTPKWLQRWKDDRDMRRDLAELCIDPADLAQENQGNASEALDLINEHQ